MKWFKRKSKANRRASRGHVLDVKLRSDHVRATRVRIGALTFGVMFGTVFGFYILWRTGEWALNRFVYENNAFAVQQVDAQTDGEISPEQLRRWSGVKTGDNLFAIDLAQVKRSLEMVPQIKTISLERVFPHTLRLRVEEREPIAQINAPRRSASGGVEVAVFQLDSEGVVMIPLDPRQRTTALNATEEPLPVLRSVKFNELQPNRRIEAPNVQAALKLVSAFECSPMAGLVDLKSIDVGSPDVLAVSTGQGSEVIFGLNDVERQLRRWREIYDFGARNHRNLATLDLAVTNNIPVRWLEASVTPEPAKAPRATRTRRKNV